MNGATGASSARDAEPDLADAAMALGLAVFRHDYVNDRIHWSAEAETVLGLNRFELPLSGRAFERMLAPQAAGLRLAASPPERLPADKLGPHYRVRYELRPSPGRAFGIEVEEEGRWTADDGGRVTGCFAAVRAIERLIEPPAAPDKPAGRRLDGVLPREDLLAVLDGTARTLSREPARPATFMLIAVAEIGRINANYGYETGDRSIELVRQRIAKRMRQGDILGHLSGPKFGAILFDCDEVAGGTAARRFREAVREQPLEIEGTSIRCDVDIGAVLLPASAATGSSAAIRAEEALAEARLDADLRFAVFRPSPAREAERRRNVESAEMIRIGLDEGRFVLAYQPVVDAQSRTVLSYEALSRLVLADGRIVSGGPYVEAAERLGLVRRIDLRSLTLALADLQACPQLRLGVNVSAETVVDPVWLSTLLSADGGARELLSRLTVEITETAAMSSIDEIVSIVALLRQAGCRIAIDDFGSGHTSLKVLRDLKPDWVKIDGAYVRSIAVDPDAVVFVKVLADLAGHFGIGTVAEYVQDERSAAILTGLGITALQGRHVGEPKLRWGAEALAALGGSGANAREMREADGYCVTAGFLEGMIGVDPPVA
jgi:diguanylate cyclase (GGDEF)-like protein